MNEHLRGVDASPLSFKEYASFIAALGEYRKGASTPPLPTLHASGDLLEHLYFSFLISGSRKLFFRLLELTKLSIVYTKEEAIVSGTLADWHLAVIHCLETVYLPTIEMRKVFNELMNFFTSIGLQAIFHSHRKLGLKDGTYLLEYKK